MLALTYKISALKARILMVDDDALENFAIDVKRRNVVGDILNLDRYVSQ